MGQKHSYPWIDIGKFIAALLVIAIHTDPLATYSELGNFAVTRLAGRIAVPFFFICSGYFLFSKFFKSHSSSPAIVHNYIKKIAWIYLFSIVLYLPVNWYKGDFNGELSAHSLLKTVIFDGTFYHLWYLPALILGSALVYWLFKAFAMKTVMFSTLCLYILGLLGDSYFGLTAEIPWLSALYNQLFFVFDYTRNGLFFAPLLIAFGAWAAANQSRQKHIKQNCLLFIGSLIAFICESLVIHHYNLPRHDSMTIFLVPTVVFLFLILLHHQGKSFPYLRNTSLWIYIFHPLMIIVVRGFGKLTGTVSIVVENSLIHFLLVTCLSVAFSACFVWLLEYAKSTALRFRSNRHKECAPKIESAPKIECTPEILRAYALVSKDRLTHNLHELQRYIPSTCKIMAVVKADAYGHGAANIAAHLQHLGVEHFAVATLEEGIALRRQNINGEILILGYTPVHCKKALIDHRLTQTIFDLAYAQSLCHTPGKVFAHVKIDTGMNRLGERSDNILSILSIYKQQRLTITGTYSHLSRVDSLKDEDIAFTQNQIRTFDSIIAILKDNGLQVGNTHLQSSCAILNYPDLSYDLVRPGIALYGVLSDCSHIPITKARLLPVMGLYAKIASIKHIQPGETIGYGTHTAANTQCTVAVVSIGYADGIPRSLSNQHCQVLINGQYAQIVGTICMDQMIIDITNLHDIDTGDTVTLFGEDRGHTLSVDQWSRLGNTINNEILSRIGTRVPRFFL